MARTAGIDPLTRYAFIVYIEINDGLWTKAAFESITSPRVDIATTQYREGGRHLNPHSITEGATFSPLTMQRGKTTANDFYRWMAQVYRAFHGDKNGNTTNYRGMIYIDHVNRAGKVIKKYILQNARPTSYIPTSGLNATDDSAVSIESLTVEYEGYAELSADFTKLGAILGSQAGALAGKLTGSDGFLAAGPILL